MVDPLTQSRIVEAGRLFQRSVPMFVTPLMIENNNPDTTEELRNLLLLAGLHDYDTQARGEESAVTLATTYLEMASNGTIRALPLPMRLYRSATKKRTHKRFSLLWGRDRKITAGDWLVFGVNTRTEVFILNLTRGSLPDENVVSGPTWQKLVMSLQPFLQETSFGSDPEMTAHPLITTDKSGEKILWPSGQGFLTDAKLRRSIELHAEEVTMRLYESEGDLTPQKVGKPYDLLIEREGDDLHIEVKGSISPVDKVFLTRNEVSHAMKYPNVDLVVVDCIQCTLSKDGQYQLRGGRVRRWKGWIPPRDSLSPVSYEHDLRKVGGGVLMSGNPSVPPPAD
jgi:hypothetical protein